MKNIQEVIDKIPPDAWPMIDLLFRITIGIVLVWLAFAIVAAWRRHAYNLTVASTARRSKKAQPDFLNVNEKARRAAIRRGDRHEDMLEDREEDEAAAKLRAAKGPVSIGQRIASLAALLMSIFTLITGIMGIVGNVGQAGDYINELTSTEKLQYLLNEHLIGTVIVLLVVAYHIYKYFADRKWRKG